MEFTTERCQGCHGGDDKWTVSKRFYAPDTATTDALGAAAYAVPAVGIFPLEFDPAATHTLRTGTVGTNDSMQCALRNVNTFGLDDSFMGIAEPASSGAVGQGGAGDTHGYNPPSLLGLSVGAPYFHAGQAATLEASLTNAFAKHHAVIDPNFLVADSAADRATHTAQLVQ